MFCRNCGVKIGEVKFCPNCGTSTANIAPTVQPTIVIANFNAIPNINENVMTGVEISVKSKMVTLILSIFFGGLGIHRFYVGKIGSGVLWFFTGGLFMIGWIYDIIKIATGTFRDGAELPIVK